MKPPRADPRLRRQECTKGAQDLRVLRTTSRTGLDSPDGSCLKVRTYWNSGELAGRFRPDLNTTDGDCSFSCKPDPRARSHGTQMAHHNREQGRPTGSRGEVIWVQDPDVKRILVTTSGQHGIAESRRSISYRNVAGTNDAATLNRRKSAGSSRRHRSGDGERDGLCVRRPWRGFRRGRRFGLRRRIVARPRRVGCWRTSAARHEDACSPRQGPALILAAKPG
jgi:hypothetical protein